MAAFSLSNLRYEDVREGCVEFIKDNTDIVGDFDFKGSNIKTLINILSYFNMMFSYELAGVANSIFLDTTDLRKNAVSIAKSHGYRPKRKLAAKLVVKFEYIGENFSPEDKITIPIKTIFKGKGTGLPFVNISPVTLKYESPLKLSVEFMLYQGEFKSYETFGTGKLLQEFKIPSENVEEKNMTVFVKATSGSYDEKEKWTQLDSFANMIDDKIYFVEEDVARGYWPKIIFGNSIIGKIPQNTETILVEYIETKGSEGNGEIGIAIPTDDVEYLSYGINNFSPKNLIGVVHKSYPSFGGTDNEDINDIKTNAPKFYSSAGRGVTDTDYKAILSSFSSDLKYFNVIGGNQLYPNDKTKLGVSYITAVPFLNDNFEENESIYLSEVEENALLPSIRKVGVIATERIFMKPTYIFLDISTSIEVPVQYTTSEMKTTLQVVHTVLKKYYRDNLSGLGLQYRQSKLGSAVDNTSGVVSSTIETLFYFMITYESFYNTRETVMYLPVIYKRDELGNIEMDKNNNPLTTNIIKRKSKIIEQENEKDQVIKLTNGKGYTQEDLPINLCSIYGKVEHANIERYIFNIDKLNTEFLQIIPITHKIITYNKIPFYDVTNTYFIPDIIEVAANTWNVEFNNIYVATVYRNEDVTGLTLDQLKEKLRDRLGDSEYDVLSDVEKERQSNLLKDEFCILRQDDYELNKLGVDGNIEIKKVQETREDGSIKEYFSMNFMISSLISDVRLYTKTKLFSFTYGEEGYLVSFAKAFGEGFEISAEVLDDKVTCRILAGESSILGTIIKKLDTDGNPVKDADGKEVYEFSGTNNGYLRSYGLRDDVILEDGTVYGFGFYHDSSIGRLNYDTGELKYREKVKGYRNFENKEAFTQNLKEIFNNYSKDGKMMNRIQITPDNIYNSEGLRISVMTDLDGVYNQCLIADIKAPERKVV